MGFYHEIIKNHGFLPWNMEHSCKFSLQPIQCIELSTGALEVYACLACTAPRASRGTEELHGGF